MSDALDAFVRKLQERIFDEARTAYGETGVERWRNPRCKGFMENADGHGRLTGSCGDTMQIFLKFEKERVKTATFLTDGCASSQICASLAAELSIGKTPDEVTEVTGEKILATLGVFPEEEEHCAFLAASTLHEAVGDYVKKQIRKGSPCDLVPPETR